jgi:DNA-binding transcriptional ArsR family regulator
MVRSPLELGAVVGAFVEKSEPAARSLHQFKKEFAGISAACLPRHNLNLKLTARFRRNILNHMVQYSPRIDKTFSAISDPTRRGILVRLGRGDATISDLASRFGMTLTGMKKHVHVLEDAGLVTTEKVGRVRNARLGPRTLEAESEWIAMYQQMLEGRLNRLGEFLERTKGEE